MHHYSTANMASDITNETDSEPSDDEDGYSTISLTEEELEEFKEELKKMSKKIKVLCCGPTGVGKSTLLNGLMGIENYSDGAFAVGDSLNRGTLRVNPKTFTNQDIEITLLDTPGLEGCAIDDAYLQDIKREGADYDIFLFCINGAENRATEVIDEDSSLVKFTTLFGVSLWENSLIILTQANAIVADLEEEKEIDPSLDVEKQFQERLKEWQKALRSELKKLGVSESVVKRIPILPAGAAKADTLHLPGRPYWLSKIFEKTTDRMKYKAKMSFLKYSADRMTSKEDANDEANSKKPINEQKFVLPRKFKWLTALATAGVGTAGAAAGGTAGALIGALLIGIPSFGVFAGGGLALGAVLGAAIGGGGALATAAAIRFFKKKKAEKRQQIN